MTTYFVCWSGGLDSTCVVTQLSLYPVTIRPFYIRGQTFRLSEPQELMAIREIRELLRADSRTKAEILPTQIVEKDDPRIKDREIINAHRRIYIRLLGEYKAAHGGILPPAGSQQIYVDGAFISPQYVACASLVKHFGGKGEVGLLADDFAGQLPALKASSTVLELDEETGRDLLRICKDNTDSNVYTLFKDLRFPLAGQGMYKRDVWHWFEEHDYLHIRAKTITCQAPFLNKDGTWEPCGKCKCCIAMIREGVTGNFTKEGLERYRDYEQNYEKEPKRFRLKAF